LAVILDTNALSALADGDPKLEPVLLQASELSIPVIVLGEYKFGVRQSRNRSRYQTWLSDLETNCRVLDIDAGTAEHYADIRTELKLSGRPIPSNDLWIAALARQHHLPVLSLDQHFDFVARLKRFNW
jgi:tRNA(fMet)-specific endonuclease VapC